MVRRKFIDHAMSRYYRRGLNVYWHTHEFTNSLSKCINESRSAYITQLESGRISLAPGRLTALYSQPLSPVTMKQQGNMAINKLYGKIKNKRAPRSLYKRKCYLHSNWKARPLAETQHQGRVTYMENYKRNLVYLVTTGLFSAARTCGHVGDERWQGGNTCLSDLSVYLSSIW